MRVGLRFERADADRLRTLAERVRSGEVAGQSAVFGNAAIAAESGEPLIVECANVEEAKVLAAGYVFYGVTEPTIDELAGFIAPN